MRRRGRPQAWSVVPWITQRARRFSVVLPTQEPRGRAGRGDPQRAPADRARLRAADCRRRLHRSHGRRRAIVRRSAYTAGTICRRRTASATPTGTACFARRAAHTSRTSDTTTSGSPTSSTGRAGRRPRVRVFDGATGRDPRVLRLRPRLHRRRLRGRRRRQRRRLRRHHHRRRPAAARTSGSSTARPEPRSRASSPTTPAFTGGVLVAAGDDDDVGHAHARVPREVRLLERRAREHG